MIFFETAGQARTFLLLLYAGFGAGLFYDALALVCRRFPVWARAGADVLWCLLTACACAFALAVGGERAARLYALLGLCCGGLLYGLGLRRLLQGCARWTRRFRKNVPAEIDESAEPR